MLQKFPIYDDIFDESALVSEDPIIEIEEERYATNHAKIGTQLGRGWQLSEPLCMAILHHHSLPPAAHVLAQITAETRMLIAVGLAAEEVYCDLTKMVCREWAQAEQWAHGELGQTRAAFVEMTKHIRDSLNRV